MSTGLAGHKIKRVSNGQHDPKIEIDAVFLALRARDALHQIRNIRLGSLIKFHVGMDGKGIPAGETHAFTLAVGLHGAPIDPKLVGFANGAPDGAQTRFDLFDGYGGHGFPKDAV